jgi:hypothetical protein
MSLRWEGVRAARRGTRARIHVAVAGSYLPSLFAPILTYAPVDR